MTLFSRYPAPRVIQPVSSCRNWGRPTACAMVREKMPLWERAQPSDLASHCGGPGPTTLLAQVVRGLAGHAAGWNYGVCRPAQDEFCVWLWLCTECILGPISLQSLVDGSSNRVTYTGSWLPDVWTHVMWRFDAQFTGLEEGKSKWSTMVNGNDLRGERRSRRRPPVCLSLCLLASLCLFDRRSVLAPLLDESNGYGNRWRMLFETSQTWWMRVRFLLLRIAWTSLAWMPLHCRKQTPTRSTEGLTASGGSTRYCLTMRCA